MQCTPLAPSCTFAYIHQEQYSLQIRVTFSYLLHMSTLRLCTNDVHCALGRPRNRNINSQILSNSQWPFALRQRVTSMSSRLLTLSWSQKSGKNVVPEGSQNLLVIDLEANHILAYNPAAIVLRDSDTCSETKLC